MHRPVVTGISNQPRARALAEAPVRGVHARRQSGPVTVSDAGELEVRLVPWDTPATVSDDGRARYPEPFAPSPLSAPAGMVIPVCAGHAYTPDGELARGPLVGRVDDVDDREDGLYG